MEDVSTDIRRAVAALSERCPGVAEELLVNALARAPDDVRVLHLLGVSQRLLGKGCSSVRTLQRALALAPGAPLVLMDLGISEFEEKQAGSALSRLLEASRLAPQVASIWYNLGRMLHLEGADSDAQPALLRAVELEPAHMAARLLLAEMAFSRGHADAAVAQYRAILMRQPDHAKAWAGLCNVKIERFSPDDVERLREAFRRAPSGSQDRASLGFSLSRALEDQESFDQAFAALSEANRVMSHRARWNPQSARRDTRAIMKAFPSPCLAARGQRGEEIIFVVSLPRSGSTLVEQILSSHPDVRGGGEVLDLPTLLAEESTRTGKAFHVWAAEADAATWERLGQIYLERTASLRTQCRRSTDKNLLNWQFVGAIRAMLPGASIVNCRREPVDTCLAGFRQLFNRGNDFSYDIAHMASRWHDYDQACRHWQSLFGARFNELQYEELIADPESQIRRLLALCELPFDPACLAFHHNDRIVRTASAVQVRQPLQRGVDLAGRYGRCLDPLRQQLAEPCGDGE